MSGSEFEGMTMGKRWKVSTLTALATGILVLQPLSVAHAGGVASASEVDSLRKDMEALRAELQAAKEKIVRAESKQLERAVVELVDSAPAAATGNTPASSLTDLTALKAEVESLKAKAAAAEEAKLAKEMEDLQAADAEREKPSLRIYGFADAGLSKMFLSKNNPIYPVYPARKVTFLPGYINVYLDGRLSSQFRSLIETRYTFVPHGDVPTNSLDLRRTDTRTLDTLSPSGYNKVIWGGVVVERSQLDWTPSQSFNLRIGYFLTPYGIWNVDHGTPTLISLLLPQFQIEEAIPQRQTGIQVFGSLSAAPFEIGYAGYVSNGRAPFIYRTAESLAGGGRLFLRHLGNAMSTVGLSGFTGSFWEDKLSVNLTDGRFRIGSEPTVVGKEWSIGADLSVDWKGFRLRSEGLIRHVRYDEGKHESGAAGPGTYRPNRFEHYGYVLGAYRIGSYFEPYLYQELKYGSPAYSVASFANTSSFGLNVYLTPTVMVKTQVAWLRFYNRSVVPDPEDQNFKYIVCRAIMVF